jgi:hypothetical protein
MFSRIGQRFFTHSKADSLRISEDERQHSPLMKKMLANLQVAAIVIDINGNPSPAIIPHLEHLTREGIKIGTKPSIYECMPLLEVHNPYQIVKIADTAEGINEGLTMGSWTVAFINSEESSTEQQKKCAAHYKILTLLDLPTIIADIQAQLSSGITPHASLPRILAAAAPSFDVLNNPDAPFISFPT